MRVRSCASPWWEASPRRSLVLLEIWLWAGVPKLYAPLCVFLVAFPVNFLMVRFALRGRLKS